MALCGCVAELQRLVERYPDLHVVMVEVNVDGWRGRCRRSTSTTSRTSGTAGPSRSSPKSRATTSGARCTRLFQEDPVALHNIPLTGTDCLGQRLPAPREHLSRFERVPGRLSTSATTTRCAIVFDNVAPALRLLGACRRSRPVSTSTSPSAHDTGPSRRDIAVERSITKARARARNGQRS